MLRTAKQLVVATFLAQVLFGGQALAQAGLDVNTVPPEQNVDGNDVDLASGRIRISKALLVGGNPDRPLTLALQLTTPSSTDYWFGPFTRRYLCYYQNCPIKGLGYVDFSIHGFVDTGSQTPLGTIGNVSSPVGNAMIRFGNPYRTTNPDGTYSWPSVGPSFGVVNTTPSGSYTYIDTAGNVTHYRTGSIPYIDKIVFHDGEVWQYYYSQIQMSGSPPGHPPLVRLKFVVSTRGYGLQFSYGVETIQADNDPAFVAWYNLGRVTFYNKSQVYCNEALLVDCAQVSSLSYAANFSSDMTAKTITITPPGEQSEVLAFSSIGDVVSRNRPTVPNSTITYSYDHNAGFDSAPPDSVLTVTKGGETWNYSHPGMPYESAGYPFNETYTMATDPTGRISEGTGLSLSGALTAYRRLGDSGWVGSGYSYDNNYRLSGVFNQEGDSTVFTRDTRGNAIEARKKAKPGSGLVDIVTTAVYPPTCSNFKTCNKPTSITDPRLNTTSYTYSPDHGGVLTETGPAVGGVTPTGWVPTGIQSVKRYSYVQRKAWVKSSTGGYVEEAMPIWLLSEERFCKTGATLANNTGCVLGASDEVVTVYDYGPNSGPNNLFLRGVAVTADGVTQRTCYGYDVNGRKIYETKPRAGLASCN